MGVGGAEYRQGPGRLDADTPIETEIADGRTDDGRLIPLQPRHGPQPKRLR